MPCNLSVEIKEFARLVGRVYWEFEIEEVEIKVIGEVGRKRELRSARALDKPFVRANRLSGPFYVVDKVNSITRN